VPRWASRGLTRRARPPARRLSAPVLEGESKAPSFVSSSAIEVTDRCGEASVVVGPPLTGVVRTVPGGGLSTLKYALLASTASANGGGVRAEIRLPFTNPAHRCRRAAVRRGWGRGYGCGA
jgi:hypothetical protein